MLEPDLNDAEAVENSEDESSIITDQDETREDPVLDADDIAMGGNGTPDDFGSPGEEFAQGDIDLVDQVARATRTMDHALGADRKTEAEP